MIRAVQLSIAWKEPVRTASSNAPNVPPYTSLPLSGIPSPGDVGGVTLVNGDRVLVKDQGNEQENGIYIVNEFGPWERAYDFRTGVINGDAVLVTEGAMRGQVWSLSTAFLDQNILVGVTPLRFKLSPNTLIVVPNVSALKALQDRDIPNGAQVYVGTLKTTWTRVETAYTHQTDGITCVRSLSNTAYWYRNQTPHAGFTYFYTLPSNNPCVDAVSGNDEYDGTIGSPLKSMNELSRRLSHTPGILGYVPGTLGVFVGLGGLKNYNAESSYVEQTWESPVQIALFGLSNVITSEVTSSTLRDTTTIPQTLAQRQTISTSGAATPLSFSATKLYSLDGNLGFALSGVGSTALGGDACDCFFEVDNPPLSPIYEMTPVVVESLVFRSLSSSGTPNFFYNLQFWSLRILDTRAYTEGCIFNYPGGGYLIMCSNSRFVIRNSRLRDEGNYSNILLSASAVSVSRSVVEGYFGVAPESVVSPFSAPPSSFDFEDMCFSGTPAAGISLTRLVGALPTTYTCSGNIELRDNSFVQLEAPETVWKWMDAGRVYGVNTIAGPSAGNANGALFTMNASGIRSYYPSAGVFTVTRTVVGPDWSYVNLPPGGTATGAFAALGAGSSAPNYFTGIVQKA